MGRTLATMLTLTTYGSWLRGDRRGWVDDGEIFPADPVLEAADRARMKHSPFLFPRDRLLEIGQHIGEALTSRLDLQVYALTIGTWHAHVVFGPAHVPLGDVVRTAKDAARYGLAIFDRPVWTEGYDKRFCFDTRAVRNRVAYVERHNTRHGWTTRPWPFITQYKI
ncbi:MAG: hypothetical protein AB7G28_03800 [Pirellulales bacterium]